MSFVGWASVFLPTFFWWATINQLPTLLGYPAEDLVAELARFNERHPQ